MSTAPKQMPLTEAQRIERITALRLKIASLRRALAKKENKA